MEVATSISATWQWDDAAQTCCIVASTPWALVHVLTWRSNVVVDCVGACRGHRKWLGTDFGGASETWWWHGDAGHCGGG